MENILKITVYGWKTSKEFRSYEPKQSRTKKELKLTLEASETKYERILFELHLQIYLFT